jgi:hypothetical protein
LFTDRPVKTRYYEYLFRMPRWVRFILWDVPTY